MKTSIDSKQFVKAYMEAYIKNKTYDWLADKLGVTKKNCRSKRLHLVSNGLKLPKLKQAQSPRPKQQVISEEDFIQIYRKVWEAHGDTHEVSKLTGLKYDGIRVKRRIVNSRHPEAKLLPFPSRNSSFESIKRQYEREQ